MKKLIATVLLSFLLVTQAWPQSAVRRRPIFPAAGGGSITFDSIGAEVSTSSNATDPVTWTHTVGGTANWLEVCLYTRGAIPSGVTANGSAMTAFASSPAVNGINRAFRWYLHGGPTGTVTFSLSVGGTGEYIHVNSVSYIGVSASSPRNVATATGATTTPSVAVTSASNDMVTDCLGSDSFTYTAGADQTERIVTDPPSSSSEVAAGASTTMSWTQGSTDAWAIHGASLIPQ